MITLYINATRYKFNIVVLKHNKQNKLKHPNKCYQAFYQVLIIHEDLIMYG